MVACFRHKNMFIRTYAIILPREVQCSRKIYNDKSIFEMILEHLLYSEEMSESK